MINEFDRSLIEKTLESLESALVSLTKEREGLDKQIQDTKSNIDEWRTRLAASSGNSNGKGTRRKKGQSDRAVLEILSSLQVGQGKTMPEISHATGIPQSSVFRALKRGEKGGKYELGSDNLWRLKKAL